MTGNKLKRYGMNTPKLSLANRSFYGIKRKRHERNTKESKKVNNKYTDSGKSELIMGSSSSNSEEHEIIRRSDWMRKCSQGKNKKMKMGSNWKAMVKCSVENVMDSNNSIFDHYRIMREILSRLPVKSLMRFKCVCKHWLFSICQDQGLIDLHFNHSKQHCPDLSIAVPLYTKVDLYNESMIRAGRRSTNSRYAGMREYEYKQSLLLGNLFESGTFKTTVTKSEQSSFLYSKILKPVSGLICFVNRRLAAVRILNPSTRESTPWIASSLRQNKNYNFIEEYAHSIWLPTYFFGFDPVTKQHKVLCAWRVRGPVTRSSNILKIGGDRRWTDFCEVLTVGENTWRYVDEKVPFSHNVEVSVYSNGVIYWGNSSIGVPEKINAFDVGREKFKVITVPQKIRDKCEDPPGGDCWAPHHSLMEVGGHIALLQRWTDRVVKLWICGDDTFTGSYNKWTKVTIKLPFQWGGRHGRFPYFHGVAGEDRIIIESYPTLSRDIKKVSLYSYNWKEKTSTKNAKDGVVSELVSGSLYSELSSVSLFNSFEASLWPVREHRFRHNQEIEKVRLRLNVDVTAAPDTAPVPAPVETFTDMGLHDSIMKDIVFHAYCRPTSIQAQAIPIALNGRDILGCAETGSGKTAAFAIPMIQHCLSQPSVRQGDGPLALVLATTSEHAQQIEKEVKAFTRSLESFRTAIVVGGTNMAEQRSELPAGVHIVVATPGGLIDHLHQENTCLSRISFVVLDEADRMLDMGFEPQIREVMRSLPIKHQTLLFGATMPVEIEALAQKYLTDSVQVKIGKASSPTTNVSQMLQKAPESEKVNTEDSC